MRCFRVTVFTLVFLVSFSSSAWTEEPTTLRVLSYNIHHAQGIDGKLDLERIAKVITSVKPDLVALQEVDQKTSRTNHVDQPAELARLTKMEVAFGPNIEFGGGKYGNAVLSRYPIKRSRNVLLPNHREGEQRGMLMADIPIPGTDQSVALFATHLDHREDDSERVASAEQINKLIGNSRYAPTILAGDLNDVINSETLQTFHMMWTPANQEVLPTVPVGKPDRQIDFILTRPADRWKVVEVKVLEEAVASDHRAILAVFELLPVKE